MKSVYLIAFILLLSLKLSAQQTGNKPSAIPIPTPPLPFRQVSGVVLDTTGNPLPAATIKLKSAKDSVITTSDSDGVFIFTNVKMATFVLTVSETGFVTAIRKCLNNDLAPKIVIQPIILKDPSILLKQVTISGRPSIIYKPDTVEFRASDYKVPPYATVDELLKHIPGMEVGADGSLLYQGQQVTQAKLNGKAFAGGDVKQAIQNLPAEIVDKIQVVDDYGDLAARTGVKTGEPQKSLNVTTRADKSIGTTARLTAQYGNDDRYNNQLFLQHLNANQVYGVIGNLKSTVNGIASTIASPIGASTKKGATDNTTDASSSGSPGTTKSGTSTLNYRNNWGTKLEVVGSYTYNFSNNIAINNSYGQTNSSRGASTFTDQSTSNNNSNGHNVKFEIDYTNHADFFQISPSFSYNGANSSSNSLTNNLNFFTTGFEHPVVNKISNNQSTTTNYGMRGLFVHAFKKPNKNLSVTINFSSSNTTSNGDNIADYRYYPDSTQNASVKDSLSHLLTQRTNKNNTFQSIITYAEPLNAKSRLEFVGQFRRTGYNTVAISDTILANGSIARLTRLDNIYDYSFTETNLRFNYSYGDKKTTLTLGAAIIPSVLAGTREDNNTLSNLTTSRADFRVIPVFTYAYSWSQTERLTFNYSGSNNEPNFQYIQPFTDRSDPNNIIVGNPNLKPTFTHFIRANYNIYFSNDKLNFSLGANGRFFSNQVTTNILQVTVPLTTTISKTINETHFVNVGGNEALAGNYSISKLLNSGNISLVLNGAVNYNYTNAMSDNVLYHTEEWEFNERFGPRLILDDNKININPFIAYDVDRSFTNTLNAAPTMVQTTRLAMDGLFSFKSGLKFHYYASKNYISGIKNYDENPLVINAGIEKRFGKLQKLALTFDAFDLLHQNNFIRQTISPTGTTYTQSNLQSRYFLVGLILNLQHWGGTPMRNGLPMKRKGDGSFIN